LADRFPTTVLFTDIVDSTSRAAELGDRRWRALLDRHDVLVRGLLADHDGEEVKDTGDGFALLFPAPARAIEFGLRVREAVGAELELEIRVGMHAGECERRGKALSGIGVHIAARVVDLAEPGEVLVTSTVKDLAIGADFSFAGRGSVTLKGVPGKWRLFTASPRGEHTAAKTARRAAPAPSPAPSPAHGARLSILLVDDHPLWRQTLAGVLEQAGVLRTAMEAGSGLEAVDIATARHPDAIVMDMDLPGLHGIDAIRAIVAANPGARILVLSSSDEKQQVLDALRAGALGYMLKTAASAEIADGVRRVHRGEAVVPPALASVVLGALGTSASNRSRVIAAAASPFGRDGLAGVLEAAGCDVVARVSKSSELAGALERGADAVVLDGDGAGAWELVDAARRSLPQPALLVVASAVEPGHAAALLEHGSHGVGYVLKDRVTDTAGLATTLRRVIAGEAVLDPEILRGASSRDADPLTLLTDKEREVLKLIAEGQSNQAIGEQLFMSAKTVETRVGAIFSKLGLEDAPASNRRVLAAVTYLRGHSPGKHEG
jgi:DNA-binding NarL/FixJ family response regulator/class 3 adenylate cyclase